MTIFRTSFLNGIAVVFRLASSLVLNKIMAVYVGPGGYAVIGQFQNVSSLILSLAGGVVAPGVTKTTAQYFDDEPKQHVIWQTAIRFSFGAAIFAGIFLLFFGGWLSGWLLHREDMSGVFVCLALTLPAMAGNTLLLAIVNGKKEVGILVAANIIGSLLGLLVSGSLAFKFGLYGALVAFTINPAIMFISTSMIVSRRGWFKISDLWGRIDPVAMRELFGFGLMGLTSALTIPVSYIFIRDHLASQFGLPAAGYWQASWRISEMYLLLVTTTLSVYYLPRLAEIRSPLELKSEIFKVYSFVMPIVTLGAATIFLLRDFLIQLLFTPDFAPMRDLFAWQLIGDVLKIGSWVPAYLMLGRAMVKLYVVTEIAFSLSFVLLSWWLVGAFGLVGVSIAFAVNYAFYWVLMGFMAKYEMRSMARDTYAV